MDDLRIVSAVDTIQMGTNILKEKENGFLKKEPVKTSDNGFDNLFRNELSKNGCDPDEIIKNYDMMKGRNK